MTRHLSCLAVTALAATALVFTAPQKTAAAADGLHTWHYSDAQKKQTKKKAKRQQVYVPAPARRAYGLRNDPSFDPYGRPWRPNFYAPCYEDLGYGRFRDCSDIR